MASYDNDEGTRVEIAHRFRVSLGLVKKLLQQRRHSSDIATRQRFSGRKPMIVDTQRKQLRDLVARKNDVTLKEMRGAAGVKCSLQAINVVLGKMGVTYKKRQCAPASGTDPQPGRGGFGASSR